MNIEIANRLVQLRKASSLSQEELAARIGVSRQAVSKWERAEASPDTDNLIALARLYQISLDELLRAEEPPAPEAVEKPADTAAASQSSELVNIGWGHLHLEDEKGKVHITPGHLQVEEGGQQVHIGDGHVVVIENGVQVSDNAWRENRWLRFPYPILALIVFLGLGFGGGWWHPGWLVFLTIPLYYTLVSGGRKHWISAGTLAVAVFLLLGFLWNLWHPGWLVFLAVPVVESAVEVVRERKSWRHFAYPVLAVLIFLMLGFFGGWWGWCWMVFLTIPLYYALFPKETV